jgi:hypothetical protein
MKFCQGSPVIDRTWEIFPSPFRFVSYSKIILKFYRLCSSFIILFQVPQVIFQDSSGLVPYSQIFFHILQMIFPKHKFFSNRSRTVLYFSKYTSFSKILPTVFHIPKILSCPSSLVLYLLGFYNFLGPCFKALRFVPTSFYLIYFS